MTTEDEIQAMIDRETEACDRKDADALVALFHPDMVWPWPAASDSHDPVTWVFPMGRFDRARWKAAWQELFDDYELIHNRRETVRISISKDKDGAFAVDQLTTSHPIRGSPTSGPPGLASILASLPASAATCSSCWNVCLARVA